jgi:ATPase related to the helicase subunit of the Holliday junction resolvase
LSKDDLRTLVYSALRDHPRGLQLKDVEIEDSVVDKLIAQSEGDARFLLNQIEWIGNSLGDRKKIDEKLLEEFQYKKPCVTTRAARNTTT